MKNKLQDLNDHLFMQLERLNEEKLTQEDIQREVERTDAMIKISGQILETANTQLRAARIIAEYGGDYMQSMPETRNQKAITSGNNGREK